MGPALHPAHAHPSPGGDAHPQAQIFSNLGSEAGHSAESDHLWDRTSLSSGAEQPLLQDPEGAQGGPTNGNVHPAGAASPSFPDAAGAAHQRYTTGHEPLVPQAHPAAAVPYSWRMPIQAGSQPPNSQLPQYLPTQEDRAPSAAPSGTLSTAVPRILSDTIGYTRVLWNRLAPSTAKPATGAPGLGAGPALGTRGSDSFLRRAGLSAAEVPALAGGAWGGSGGGATGGNAAAGGPGGLPPLPVAGVGVVGKKKRALNTRTWIVISARGEWSVIEADKGTIMRRCDLPGRDLRLLDPVFVTPSTILGREKAIVVNLEAVRCIITADEVLLLNTSDPAVQQYKSTLLRRLFLGTSQATLGSTAPDSLHGFESPAKKVEYGLGGQGYATEEEELPFEFKALELALEMAISFLDTSADSLCKESYPLLDRLATQVSTANLEKVRRTKSHLLGLTGRVQKVRAEIEQLMDDDGDMYEMYLTEKRLRAEASAALTLRQQSGSHGRTGGSFLHGQGQAGPALEGSGRAGSVDSLGGFGSTSQSAPISPVGSPSLRGGFPGPAAAHARGSFPHQSSAEDSIRAQKGDSFRGSGGPANVAGAPAAPGLWGSVKSGDYDDTSDSATDSLSHSVVVNVETLEMLLEAYFVVIDSTLNKLTQLSQYIDDTEDFINIQLDNVRNQLIQFELIMTTAAFVVGLWGVVAGTFGMNVPLGVEDDPSALRRILVDSGFGGILVFGAFLLYFKHKNWTRV